FRHGIFDSGKDTKIFLSIEHVSRKDVDVNNHIRREGQIWIPTYEPKSFHQFDPRYGEYDWDTRRFVQSSIEKKRDVGFRPVPHDWVRQDEVVTRTANNRLNSKSLIACRRITNSTNERTTIASLVDSPAFNENTLLFSVKETPEVLLGFLANLNSLIFDYL